MIKIENLFKKYDNDDRTILKIENYIFPDTGMIFILGESGCGKTSFLNILSLIDEDYEGKVIINSKNIAILNDEEKTYYRKKIVGYIHQSPLLIEGMTVEENLLSSFEDDIKPENFNSIIQELYLNELLQSKTEYLSGGEKQRVALARVLLDSPKIILADEPTGNLDIFSAAKTMKILKKYSEKNLVIIVSHDRYLAEKYADQLLRIEFGKIIYNKDSIVGDRQRISFLNEYKPSKLFEKKYIKSLLNKYKFRNLIFISFLSLSLIAISCTIIIKSSIESALTDMFSGYFSEDEILVNQKGLSQSLTYRYDSLEDSYIKQISNDNSEFVKNYKYIYETNFLSLFADLNDVRLVQTFSSTVIDGYDIRNINEFILCEYISDYTYIDHTDLNNDEIIISLNDKQIYNICFSLHITRDAKSLFNLVKEKKFNISVNVRNVEIGYDEEVMFNVAGFVNENKSIFYHSNPLFNVEILEGEMQLESTLYQGGEKNPWTLKKSAVLNFFDENCLIDFLKKSYKDAVLTNFFFNIAGEKYYEKTYEEIEELKLNELVCYIKSSNGFDIKIINKLIDLKYKNIRFSTYGGYLSLGNELVSGFVNQCFLSSSLSTLQEISDLYETNYSKNIAIEDVENVIQGGINSKTNSPLKLCCKDMYDLKISNNCSEIIVSSYLYNKLGKTNKLYFSCSQNTNNKIRFKYLDFKVSKIIENDKEPILYVNPYFSILLFQYLMNYDYNSLNLKGLVFTSNSNQIEDELKILNRSFTQYEFSSPFNEIKNEMNSTLSTIQIILLVFSILSSLISLALIVIITRSIIESNYRNVSILYVYGINLADSVKYFMKYLIIMGIYSFASSLITGLFLSSLINFIIEGEFVLFKNLYSDLIWICINFVCLFIVELIAFYVIKFKIKHLKISEILSK